MLTFGTLEVSGPKMVSMLYDAIQERIANFNKMRGRRKELVPTFEEQVPRPRKKFGIILDCQAKLAEDIVTSLADKTVECMLKRKPRPQMAYFDIFDGAASPSPYLGAGKLRFRLTIDSPKVVRQYQRLPTFANDDVIELDIDAVPVDKQGKEE